MIKTTILRFEKEEKIPVNELKLDKYNNRLVHLDISTEDLEAVLWKEGKLLDLYNDIRSRGLQDPLILYPGSNIVAEGNCRLVCLKKLHRESIEYGYPSLKKFKNIVVPCRKIAKGTREINIHAYLTEIHIGRKQKWPEYNQAYLLYTLKHVDGLSVKDIANIARSSRPTVLRKIKAYEDTKKYHKEIPLDSDYVTKFYYFWELQHPDLNEFRKKQLNIQFMRWVYYNKFPTSKHVRYLPQIMNNRKAFETFKQLDMEEAVQYVKKVDPTIQSSLYRNINQLTKKLKKIPAGDLVNDKPKKSIIMDLKSSTIALLQRVEKLEARK